MPGSIANLDNVIPITNAARRRDAGRPVSFGWVLALDLALWSAVGLGIFLVV
jgi:hypothetical protein